MYICTYIRISIKSLRESTASGSSEALPSFSTNDIVVNGGCSIAIETMKRKEHSAFPKEKMLDGQLRKHVLYKRHEPIARKGTKELRGTDATPKN